MLLVALLVTAGGAHAAVTVVRSSVGAQDVRAMDAELDPHAVLSHGPYDDDANSLYDGVDYYYLVHDPLQIASTLSVSKNFTAGRVRIGFDDADAVSAPVDAVSSSVSAEPASIPADGLTTARVVIVPRDASGEALGAGLDLVVNETALLPGVPAGPVIDHGNGSYSLLVVSTTTGSGMAVLTVEGMPLVSQPVLTYELPEGLLQPIIEDLDLVIPEQSEPVADRLEQANERLAQAEAALEAGDTETAVFRIWGAIGRIASAMFWGLDRDYGNEKIGELFQVLDLLDD